MIEKYRLCDATIVDMVDKVSEIERRLAEQEPVSENTNGLRNQINTVKVCPSGCVDWRFVFRIYCLHMSSNEVSVLQVRR